VAQKKSPLTSPRGVIVPSKKICQGSVTSDLVGRKEANMAKARAQDQHLEDAFPEQGFNMPLPTLVEGTDTLGKVFMEKTILSYISENGSSFWLTAEVNMDSDLKLTVDLPSRLAEDKDLKLIIKGKVIFLEAPKNHNSRHRVSLKFENKYIIDEKKM